MFDKEKIKTSCRLLSKSDKAAVATFKALGEVSRYRIFCILSEYPELPISVIARVLDISLPLTSQHIKTLANANLIQKERIGKKVFSKLEHSNPLAQAVVKTIKQIIKIENKLKI